MPVHNDFEERFVSRLSGFCFIGDPNDFDGWSPSDNGTGNTGGGGHAGNGGDGGYDGSSSTPGGGYHTDYGFDTGVGGSNNNPSNSAGDYGGHPYGDPNHTGGGGHQGNGGDPDDDSTDGVPTRPNKLKGSGGSPTIGVDIPIFDPTQDMDLLVQDIDDPTFGNLDGWNESKAPSPPTFSRTPYFPNNGGSGFRF